MRRAAILAIAMVVAAPAFAGTMYKWKDEKGVTHFSEDPPPGGKAEKIDVRPVPPSSIPPPPPRPQDLRTREIELRQKREGKERDEQKAQQAARQREERCLRAQRNLDVLQRQRPVYSVDKQGNRVYVEDQQRAAEIEDTRKAIAENCRG
jgi:hypothetical protein